MRALVPTTTESGEKASRRIPRETGNAWVIFDRSALTEDRRRSLRGSRRDNQLFEFRDLLFDRHFDAHVQGQVRTRTGGALAAQSNSRFSAGHFEEFDIASIGLQERAESVHDGLNANWIHGVFPRVMLDVQQLLCLASSIRCRSIKLWSSYPLNRFDLIWT
jgi:hypothetical protein